ncbi:MAG: hypothetical protein IPJ39_22380 [Saprospiraceae bacterium]|nr:hypothetical protein [Saprospiraceae bacterium]
MKELICIKKSILNMNNSYGYTTISVIFSRLKYFLSHATDIRWLCFKILLTVALKSEGLCPTKSCFCKGRDIHWSIEHIHKTTHKIVFHHIEFI